MRFFSPALFLPQPTQTQRGSEFERAGVLAPGDFECLLKACFGIEKMLNGFCLVFFSFYSMFKFLAFDREE